MSKINKYEKSKTKKYRKKLTKYLIICLLIFSCTSNENKINEEHEQSSINRTWHLTSVSNETDGIIEEFNLGHVTWVFDENTHRLTIENNTMNNQPYGIQSGVYEYSIVENNGFTYVVVKNHNLTLNDLTNSNLDITQYVVIHGVGVTGYSLKFNKEIL